ncbi:MAG: ABC transporter ATP-binding protein [Ignavibacteriaceae bacterium]|nr:ABC transporter ATP-binding protein [Ignavibacteriaceae bacterium]
MPNMNALEIKGLSKIYSSHGGRRKVEALKDVSLEVESGSIFGLLGPNGAGKTTLIKIILGITHPTTGSAFILDTPVSNYLIRRKIGYLPENHKFPNYLTGGEVLKYFGQLAGAETSGIENKIDNLLELVKLTKWKKSKIKTYSKGMMQRLGIAQALINNPEVIFLDEPTDGVDPIGRKEIRDILADLKQQGKTIFLNSHLLSEVELVTDRVAILNKGMLLRIGSVNELTAKKEEYKVDVDAENLLDQISSAGLSFHLKPQKSKDSFLLNVSNENELNEFIDFIRSRNILIKEVVKVKNSLEDMFINLINESEGEDKK